MTAPGVVEDAAANYVAFYESLAPETLGQLDSLCAPTVRFSDPFNDVNGIDAYRAILIRMFEDVVDPRFKVLDRAMSGRVAYLRWQFSFVSRNGENKWTFNGMSEVHIDETGCVTLHVDHWDAGSQFYGRLPVLRHVIEFVRRRISRH